MTDSPDFLLSAFWNELVQPGGEPVTGEHPLDPTLAETVRRVQHLGASPPPQPVRERLRERVMTPIDGTQPEHTMSSIATTTAFPGVNGHRPGFRIGLRQPNARRGRMALFSIAAAVLIGLAALAGLIASGNLSNPWPDGGSHAVVPAAQDTQARDWNQYRNGPGHTGVAGSIGPEQNPTVLWQAQTGGGINSEAAVVGGIVYIGSGDGFLFALDAASGETRWRFDAGEAVDSAPVVANGAVFITSRNNELIAVRAESGEEAWRFPTASGDASAVYADETIFVAGSDGSVYALDPDNGSVKWSHALGTETARTPAFADGVLFAGTTDGQLVALDGQTGDERWRFQGDAGLVSSTVIAGGTIYQAIRDSETNALYAIDAADGREQWRFQTASQTGVGIPTVQGNRVYVTADDGKFYALDAAIGVVQWAVSGTAPWPADAKLANGILYVYNPLVETLYAFDANSGAMIWSLEGYAWTGKGPAIVDGVLYSGTDDGFIVAIGAGDSPVQAASPQPQASPMVSVGPGQTELLWSTTGPEANPLELPQDIGIAPDGKIYVLNPVANNFSIFSPDGEFIETWGEKGTGPGQFHFYGPNLWIGGVDFDADGNIYVFDLHNNRIQKFSPDRSFIKEWGAMGDGVGEFIEPEGAVDAANGLVYVTDLNNRVQVFDLDGNYLDRWGQAGSDPAQFLSPRGVAIDSEGNVFVAEQQGHRFQKFDSSGQVIDTSTTDYPTQGTGMLFYLTIGPDDMLYLPDWEGNRILIFDRNGALIAEISEIPGFGDLASPVDIEFDAEGFAYITLENSNTLLKVRLAEQS